jgi:CheY-like chemotaxis protein
MIEVLYVDDEPDIREIAALTLGLDPEFTVKCCASGIEALKIAVDEVPDVILLDVMMPLMDGPTTLEHLQQNPRTAAVPVIFITARTQPQDITAFRELGAIGIIAKPFDPMRLAQQVRTLLK